MYDDNVGAKAALEANQIDAAVFDLPTAFYVSGVEIDNSASSDSSLPTPAAPPTSSGSSSRRTAH